MDTITRQQEDIKHNHGNSTDGLAKGFSLHKTTPD